MIGIIMTIIIVAIGFGIFLNHWFNKISVSINNDISSKLEDVTYLLKSLKDNIVEINKKTKSLEIIEPKNIVDEKVLYNNFKHLKLSDIVGESYYNKNKDRISKYSEMNLDNPQLDLTIYKYYFMIINKECVKFEKFIMENVDIDINTDLIDRIEYLNNQIKSLNYNIDLGTTTKLDKQFFIREKQILENHLNNINNFKNKTI